MKNKYRIEGDVAYIETSNGEFMIDTEDLPFVDYITKGTWQCDQHGYARNSVMLNGVVTRIALHRLLVNPGKGLHVDHINRDPRDNRKENLRKVTRRENMQNRKDNTKQSGHQYIYWDDSKTKKWVIRYPVGKTFKYGGRFETVAEAVERLKELIPESTIQK